jgi:hypothetical protein
MKHVTRHPAPRTSSAARCGLVLALSVAAPLSTAPPAMAATAWTSAASALTPGADSSETAVPDRRGPKGRGAGRPYHHDGDREVQTPEVGWPRAVEEVDATAVAAPPVITVETPVVPVASAAATPVVPAPAPVAATGPRAAFTSSRSGGFDGGFDGWDFGGPSVLPGDGGEVVRDASLAYEGSAAARATIPAGSGNKYARTLWGGIAGQTGSLDYGEGKDFTYGMALYLPAGFYANMQSYFVPMRWDNYGVTHVSRGGLSMHSDGSMRLFRERDGIEQQVSLLGDTTHHLAEGQWHWLEVRQTLSSVDGSAVNELRVDDALVGRSTTRNYYGEPVSAIRYGIVAIAAGTQTRALTVHYDRAVLGTGQLGR